MAKPQKITTRKSIEDALAALEVLKCIMDGEDLHQIATLRGITRVDLGSLRTYGIRFLRYNNIAIPKLLPTSECVSWDDWLLANRAQIAPEVNRLLKEVRKEIVTPTRIPRAHGSDQTNRRRAELLRETLQGKCYKTMAAENKLAAPSVRLYLVDIMRKIVAMVPEAADLPKLYENASIYTVRKHASAWETMIDRYLELLESGIKRPQTEAQDPKRRLCDEDLARNPDLGIRQLDIPHRLAMMLMTNNLFTIEDLVRLIETKGYRWRQGMPNIGNKTAYNIEQMLSRDFERVRTALARERELRGKYKPPGRPTGWQTVRRIAEEKGMTPADVRRIIEAAQPQMMAS